MHGWTDPFDPDRTYSGGADQWSDPPPIEYQRRGGRHRAPEPYDGTEPLAGDRYRPVLHDPPAESGDEEHRWLSRPVILSGVATVAVLAVIVGLLIPRAADPATTASAGDGTTAAADPGMAGGDGSPFELPTGFPAQPAQPRAAPSAPASRPPALTAKPTEAAAPVAPSTPTAGATPRHNPSTAGANASASPGGPPVQQVVSLVNQERSAAGCEPLTVDTKLTTAAQLHSEDQAAHQNMSHTGSDGSSLQLRIERVDYRWRTIGENVAYGQTTPTQVMNDWMNSDGHRRNILNCQFEDIGVGVARDSDGRLAWTQDFGA